MHAMYHTNALTTWQRTLSRSRDEKCHFFGRLESSVYQQHHSTVLHMLKYTDLRFREMGIIYYVVYIMEYSLCETIWDDFKANSLHSYT